MTIGDIVELYNRKSMVAGHGTTLACRELTWQEIERNKEEAYKRMQQFSKDELIRYILLGSLPKKK